MGGRWDEAGIMEIRNVSQHGRFFAWRLGGGGGGGGRGEEEKDDDRFAVVRGTRLSSASCAGPTRCILSRDNAAWTIGARGWDGR